MEQGSLALGVMAEIVGANGDGTDFGRGVGIHGLIKSLPATFPLLIDKIE